MIKSREIVDQTLCLFTLEFLHECMFKKKSLRLCLRFVCYLPVTVLPRVYLAGAAEDACLRCRARCQVPHLPPQHERVRVMRLFFASSLPSSTTRVYILVFIVRCVLMRVGDAHGTVWQRTSTHAGGQKTRYGFVVPSVSSIFFKLRGSVGRIALLWKVLCGSPLSLV